MAAASTNIVEQMVEQAKVMYENVKLGENPYTSSHPSYDHSENDLSNMIMEDNPFVHVPEDLSFTRPVPDVVHTQTTPGITFDSVTAESVCKSGASSEKSESVNQEMKEPIRGDTKGFSKHKHFSVREPPHKPKSYGAKPLGRMNDQHLSEQAKERKVPGSRFGRVFSFGSKLTRLILNLFQ